jgi:hypothetical protein
MALDPPVLCAHCKTRRADTLDHDPPLAMHVHREGSRCCRLIPSCAECNRTGGHLVQQGRWRPGEVPVVPEPEPERDGLAGNDKRWRVPWLRPFRRVPADAVWPRLMTVPHPRAAGSLGPEFIAWAEERSGPLRWWQRLAATRILEVDDQGGLVWETVVLSMPRQLGKSWLLRELCFWRIHQRDRFGEPQDVLHTGNNLRICVEVQRPARLWAKYRPDDYRVREANGEVQIELVENGSRWMILSNEGVYGYGAGMGVVDEAWKVKLEYVDEGLEPTMAEREQPQLLLVSTAHRLATSLMLSRRALALDALEDGDDALLIEWSAHADTDVDDRTGWRQASSHWSTRRERMIEKRLQAAREGATDDPEEPDPLASFRSQWLNQWPRRVPELAGGVEELLPPGLWADRAVPGLASTGAIWVAMEDAGGWRASVAAVGKLDSGGLEVDAWDCDDWDSAVEEVQRLQLIRPVRRLLVGANMLDRVPAGIAPSPERAGGTETRRGLSLFRDLAAGGQLVHDATTFELDAALAMARVRETTTGLQLLNGEKMHVVKAAVWAVAAAHKPAPVPAIH